MTEKQGEFIRLIRPDIDFNNLTEENRKDIQEIIDKYRFTFTRLRYDKMPINGECCIDCDGCDGCKDCVKFKKGEPCDGCDSCDQIDGAHNSEKCNGCPPGCAGCKGFGNDSSDDDDDNDDDDEDDDDDDDEDDDDDNLVILKRELLTARELRRVKSWNKSIKYRFKDFYGIWVFAFFLKPKYSKILASLMSDQFYTLYDILSYIFINNHLPILYRKKLSEYRSIHDMTVYISSELEPVAKADRASPNSKYKQFETQSKRTLTRFFNFVFDREKSLDMFEENGKTVFNIIDYGFINYLLKESSYNDVWNLTHKKYELVSQDFYLYSYIGVSIIVRHHNTGYTEKQIRKMWEKQFGYKFHRSSGKTSSKAGKDMQPHESLDELNARLQNRKKLEMGDIIKKASKKASD